MVYPSRQIVVTVKNKVATIRFNNPKRYNAWGSLMMKEMKEALEIALHDKEVGAVVLTGTGKYYCSGVDFSGNMQMMRPSLMKKKIEEENAALFAIFIEYTKPVVVAANGPGIGACVTSAVLCDAILADETATFSTPFASLGIVPEGCSSYTFERKMNAENAQRMLGAEGWAPTAREAFEAGLIHGVHPDNNSLMEAAQKHAEGYIAADYTRPTQKDTTYSEILTTVNRKESALLANAFMDYPFLAAQSAFWWKKNKIPLAIMFKVLYWTKPIWSLI